jgi:hypothetical protein
MFWKKKALKVQYITPDSIHNYVAIGEYTRVYPKVSGLSRNEINKSNNNKHSLKSDTKGYGGKTHWTDSQNSDTTALSGKELYQY